VRLTRPINITYLLTYLYMLKVPLNTKQTNKQDRLGVGLEDAVTILKYDRLQWHDHALWMDDNVFYHSSYLCPR